MERVKVLSEAFSYIKEFHGKTIVIKYGGNAMIDGELKDKVINDIALLKYLGIKPIVVHGGGPDISSMLSKLGRETVFKGGNRVTNHEDIEIVEMVLGGKVNKGIVAKLNHSGARALGITGKDSKLIEAHKKYIFIDGKKEDLGYVGSVQKINNQILNELLDMDIIPVIAPLGQDENGVTYNINADYVACEIAKSMKASKLILLTDIDGLYMDITDEKSFISEISVKSCRKLMDDKVIAGGMIPKIEACISALEGGVEFVHMLNGTTEHSILMELFTKDGVGTMLIEEGGKHDIKYLHSS